ncbi:MAG: hypothetical protein IPP90_18655 [Gemmatimonadaceae bacterium]|nr:hypothetical protein [Gemmatimonadaceae bacterium]
MDATSGAEAAAAALVSREPLAFGRIVVIGGGCYGSWYAQQLTRATLRGALRAEAIIVVDRDPDCQVGRRLAVGAYEAAPVQLVTESWSAYLEQWLAAGAGALTRDAMVPSPLMPHLCLDWLMARARDRWPGRAISIQSLPTTPPMPWERAAPDGRHYVSYATWTCPVNCIEPATCPATRTTRDWSMPPALEAFVEHQRGAIDGSLIFPCVHRTYGVGMIDAHRIAGADDVLSSWSGDTPLRVLVGTVSHCHGALGILTIS